MGEKTRMGVAVIGAAFALGGLGDLLLRATPWGLNLPLWILALALAAVGLSLSGDGRPSGEGRWLLPVALLFAAGVAFRDSPVLVALDVALALLALALAALRGRSGVLRRSGVSDYVVGTANALAMTAGGMIPAAVKHVRWLEIAPGDRPKQALAVARGVLISAPLLLVFGALFVAADAVFESLVFDLFDLDRALLGHLALTLFLAWVSAGFLTFGLLGTRSPDLAPRRPDALALGIVEVGVVLGLLDALFLAFVGVQASYLFGGSERVAALTDLTYAEYARRGFFELVAVTALVIPVLLLAHWSLRPETRAHERLLRAFSGAMVLLLAVVVASALHRMFLYQQEFGLTVQRVCATVFVGWLAFVLVWFALTVLRGRREHFAFGALVAAFVVALALNVVSPDALVARVNVQRLQADERFDPYYLTLLSADAAPVLAASLPEIGHSRPYKAYAGEKGPTLEQVLEESWSRPPNDWRSWNLSRSRAEHIAHNPPVASP